MCFICLFVCVGTPITPGNVKLALANVTLDGVTGPISFDENFDRQVNECKRTRNFCLNDWCFVGCRLWYFELSRWWSERIVTHQRWCVARCGSMLFFKWFVFPNGNVCFVRAMNYNSKMMLRCNGHQKVTPLLRQTRNIQWTRRKKRVFVH